MVRGISLILVLIIFCSATVADQDSGKTEARVYKKIALVTFDPNCTSKLTSIELRKLFLGLRTSNNQSVIKPIRNRQHSQIYTLFIQSVMAMSPRSYERRLLMGTFQKGQPKPEAFNTLQGLKNALQTRPCSVSFMWASQAIQIPNLLIIQILWSGYLTE